MTAAQTIALPKKQARQIFLYCVVYLTSAFIPFLHLTRSAIHDGACIRNAFYGNLLRLPLSCDQPRQDI
jgi:hypothetical protein